MSVDDLKDLLSYLDRESAPECDHSLRDTKAFMKGRGMNPDTVIPWLNAHGGYCHCEVIYNVYDAVGDIVEWHLDEDAKEY